MFDLTDLYDEVGLADVLTGYLGERPAMSVMKCTLRRVPADSGSDWHQDGSFLGEGIRTVNVWLSLSHCGVDAPSLDVVGRRLDDLAPTGTDGACFDWSVGQAMVDQVRGDTDVLRLHFAPGDALLFDEKLLHRTAVDAGMSQERYAIETWFFAPSTYPRDQVPLVF
jgi:ectoine hydroxylase-related dioxygenase (phytanoyl-CoA dioxygenase family)